MRASVFLVAILFFFIGCFRSTVDKNTITIFHAGSLLVPLNAIADSFKRYNPEVTFNLEAAGSVESARKITDLNRQCDLFFSADYQVIHHLLFTNHADFVIPFSGNRMVIAFTPKSKFANVIDSLNWTSILLNPKVTHGRSDPNSDPCGYRTVLVLQLAEKYYGKKGFADSLLTQNIQFIRPKEVDLLTLLETGAIDYLFIYESVAKQHGLQCIKLPDSVNLGNFSLASHYSTVQVKIRGRSPNDSITIVGEPIVYAFTIPKNAPNPQLALGFAKYFLTDTGGMRVITQIGQQPLVPFNSIGCGSIPDSLKAFMSNN